jgi:dienelactone hydrolase
MTLLPRFAMLALLISAAGIWLRESALAVLVDTSLVAVVAAVLASAAAVGGLSIRRRRGQSVRTAGALAVLSFAALIATAILRWGPVRSRETSFSSEGVTLAGTLYRPRWGSALPAVAFVHGSGPMTRSEFLMYARYFSRRGIVALAYDKRGTGGSGGKTYDDGYDDYAKDAAAAANFLISLPYVAAGRVGLVGFSEAEWVAPAATGRTGSIKFLAVVGAAGTSPAEQVHSEMRIRLRQSGFPNEAIERAVGVNRLFFDYLRTGDREAELREVIRKEGRSDWYRAARKLPEQVDPREDYAWWRRVMDFDAAGAWRRVTIPVLLIKGAKDDRSPADRAVAEITRALGDRPSVSSRIFPGADHAILLWPLGDRRPPPRFAQGYPQVIVDWIQGLSAPPS